MPLLSPARGTPREGHRGAPLPLCIGPVCSTGAASCRKPIQSPTASIPECVPRGAGGFEICVQIFELTLRVYDILNRLSKKRTVVKKPEQGGMIFQPLHERYPMTVEIVDQRAAPRLFCVFLHFTIVAWQRMFLLFTIVARLQRKYHSRSIRLRTLLLMWDQKGWRGGLLLGGHRKHQLHVACVVSQPMSVYLFDLGPVVRWRPSAGGPPPYSKWLDMLLAGRP